MDEENDLLYLTHGWSDIFATFNMNSNKWNVMSKSEQEGTKYNIIHDNPNAPSLMLPNSELHVWGVGIRRKNSHIRYNKSENKFVTAATDGIQNHCYLSGIKMVFIRNKQMLMVIGGFCDDVTTDKIWVANYTGHNQPNYVWKEFKKKLPHPSYPVCTVVFGSVLIIYYKHNKRAFMWILDCGDDRSQWVKSLLETESLNNAYVKSLIATKSNHLHFINPHATAKLHYKIHLSKVIPANIYNKYTNANNADDDDVKCNQCDGLKEKLRIMETEKTSLQTLVDELLKNQNQIQQQYEAQSNEFKGKEALLVQQLNEMEAQNSKLNEECKETKLELREVKQELNQLKGKKAIDLSNYLNWSADDIVDWMMTLEQGRYAKYETKLRTVFKDESVNGRAIPFIDKAELKNWGIAHFMDRNNIHQHLQNLVAQNDAKKNSYNEGSTATAYI